MPISFACPHCGNQTSVAEQYAGQSGPCSACGKTITIPGAPVAPAYGYAPPKKSGGMGVGMVILLVLGLGALCVVLPLLALLLPAIGAARGAARRMQSQNNMKQISLGMLNYHDAYGEFPPAVVTDAAGQPLYSGRVLLLPYLEQQALFQQFKLDEAWDSPANIAFSRQSLPIFTDPSSAKRTPGQTDYLFVVGQGAALEPGGKRSMADSRDGTSNTLFMVEVKDSGISWAQPGDLTISQPMALPPGNHPRGNIGGFLDGSVKFLSEDIDPTIVRSLATREGMESVNIEY